MFKKSKLDNGMVLVTETLPHFQSLSMGVWVRSGARHELSNEAGLSHFLEHMMFKGTYNRSALEIAQAVDEVGGEFNAFTSREYTCYHILMLSKDVELATDVMLDVMLNSKFDQEEIERERKVILQEISMIEDNPEELIHDYFFEQAFGTHTLGKPILGSRRTVERFKREEIYSFFQKHYQPSDIIFSVAGNVKHDKVRRLLNRKLKDAFVHKKTNQRKPNFSKPKIKLSRKFYNRELEQSHIVLGYPGLSYDHPDRFSAFLLNIYLGGGMSSSLFQEIREKRGLAYTVYSQLAPFSDCGLFSVYVATLPKETIRCLELMYGEVKKLRESRLDPKALEILKNNLRGTILLNADSVESRMMAIAKHEMFFGKYFSLAEVEREIKRVTVDSVHRVAKQLFKPGREILSVMGPLSKKQSQQIRKLIPQK